MFFDFLYKFFFFWNISYSTMKWATLPQMYKCLHVKHSSFLSIFNKAWSASTHFQKIPKESRFVKIHSVEAELFHADRHIDRQADSRQTDMTKLIFAFRNFASAPKKTRTAYFKERGPYFISYFSLSVSVPIIHVTVRRRQICWSRYCSPSNRRCSTIRIWRGFCYEKQSEY